MFSFINFVYSFVCHSGMIGIEDSLYLSIDNENDNDISRMKLSNQPRIITNSNENAIAIQSYHWGLAISYRNSK